jgi:hypothetical protein
VQFNRVRRSPDDDVRPAAEDDAHDPRVCADPHLVARLRHLAFGAGFGRLSPMSQATVFGFAE